MRFLEIKFAMGVVLLPVPRFSPVTIIPPLLHTHPNLHTILSERQAWRPPNTTVLFRISGVEGGGEGGGIRKRKPFTLFLRLESFLSDISEISRWLKILFDKVRIIQLVKKIF